MRDLVFLPGFMLNEALWDDMRADLATLGALHFGDIGHDSSLAAMADRILQNAPEQFILFGFSMGGYVAQIIALKAPQRVQGLALLNTSSRPQSQHELAATQAQYALAERYPFKGLTSHALASSVHPDRVTDTVLLQRLQAMALKNGKDVFLRQLQTLRDGSYADLNKISCPTLVVASDADRLRTMDESKEMAQRIPGARLEVIQHSGHMTPLEQPDALMQVIRKWLAESDL